MVKWDPPLSEPAVGAGVGWRNQSEELVFISCLISCRLSSAFRSILSLPGFSGGGGSARGIKIYSLTPSSLVRGGGGAETRGAAAAAKALCLWCLLWWR